MSTRIEVSVNSRQLLDRNREERDAQRYFLVETESRKKIESDIKRIKSQDTAKILQDKASIFDEKRRVRGLVDEPAAWRSGMPMTLLPAYDSIPSPRYENQKVFLFDGPLKKGPPGEGVLGQRFGLSVGTDYDDYEYERGTYQRVTRLDSGGPGGAPVLDWVLYSEVDALTGSTGYVGQLPDDGLAVLNVFDTESLSQYQSDVLEDNDGTDNVIFAWVGFPGMGYASWYVRGPFGQTSPPPYIVRIDGNSGTSFSGNVIYFPGEEETEAPERAYLGSGTKVFSMYIRVVSGPPVQISISFGGVDLRISHSHWLGNEYMDSRLIYLGENRAEIPLSVTTDSMTDWTRISLRLSNRSYNLIVGSQTPEVGFIEERTYWNERSFFLETMKIRQAMWEGVDFGDYKSQVQISSVVFRKG